MINSRDEILGAAESEGAMADGFDLVVHSLDSAVRQTELGPGQDSA